MCKDYDNLIFQILHANQLYIDFIDLKIGNEGNDKLKYTKICTHQM